ncbi:MAG: hypothetical protein JRI68_11475, partial [Deltaproteobacteria bacterium]|nr:hypothetical protein [Deltaproteobacteria bacterium]
MKPNLATRSIFVGFLSASFLVAACGEPGETYYIDNLPTDEEPAPAEEEPTEEPAVCP